MKPVWVSSAVALVLLASCSEKNPAENIVPFSMPSSIENLSSSLMHIDLVALEDDSAHLLGSEPELTLASDGSLLLTDNRNMLVYRYSADGKFLNEIGKRGNGPAEYQNVTNVQIDKDNLVVVFSAPDKMLKYSLDGTFVSSETGCELGVQSYCSGDDILTYYGDGAGRPSRMTVLRKGKAESLLDANNKVLSFTNSIPMFSNAPDGSVLVIDSMYPDVYRYDSGELTQHVKFDFGKTSIPESYYDQESPFVAAEMLMTSDYSVIRRYVENKNYSFTEVFTSHPAEMPDFSYGIRNKDGWKWFSAGKAGESPIAASFRTLDKNNILYCIVDPALLDNCPQEILSAIRNTDVLNSISPDSNYVIFKMQLK